MTGVLFSNRVSPGLERSALHHLEKCSGDHTHKEISTSWPRQLEQTVQRTCNYPRNRRVYSFLVPEERPATQAAPDTKVSTRQRSGDLTTSVYSAAGLGAVSPIENAAQRARDFAVAGCPAGSRGEVFRTMFISVCEMVRGPSQRAKRMLILR